MMRKKIFWKKSTSNGEGFYISLDADKQQYFSCM